MKIKKQNIIKQIKRFLPYIFVALILLTLPTIVLAATTAPAAGAATGAAGAASTTPNVSASIASFGTTLAKQLPRLFNLLGIVLLVIQSVLWPILLLIGGLLTNDFLFAGGMQTMLLNVWSAVRDFVNVFFVLVILAVAIANIVGVDAHDFQIKTVLPKIIIGLILVNFSFFGAKVIIDFSNVLATSIITIPSNSNLVGNDYKNLGVNPEFVNKLCNTVFSKVPYSTVLALNKTVNQVCAKNAKLEGAGKSKSYQQTLTNYGKKMFSNLNARNVSLVMATEMMQITQIDKVDGIAVTDLKTLTINSLFSIIFFLIYAVAFIALFVALLVRTVVLWITTALLPVAVLGETFAPIGKHVKEGKNSIMGNFLKAAFLPVPISVVLAIGIIMITQLKQIGPNVINSTNIASLGLVVAGPSSLQDLLAGLATAAFIWIAVFQAIGEGPWSKFTNSIRTHVGGFATSLAKAPFYAPIIPVGGHMIGLANLASVINLRGPAAYIRHSRSEIIGEFSQAADPQRALTQLSTAKGQIANLKAMQDLPYAPTLSPPIISKMADATMKKAKANNIKFRPTAGISTWKELSDKMKHGLSSKIFHKVMANQRPTNVAGTAAGTSGTPSSGATNHDTAKATNKSKMFNLRKKIDQQTGKPDKMNEVISQIKELAQKLKKGVSASGVPNNTDIPKGIQSAYQTLKGLGLDSRQALSDLKSALEKDGTKVNQELWDKITKSVATHNGSGDYIAEDIKKSNSK